MNKPNAASQGTGSTPPARELALEDLWRMISRNRWAVAGVSFAVIALTALFTWMQPKVFEGSASLYLKNKDDGGLSVLRELGPLGGSGRDETETDMVILQSRAMAETVADSLALHVRLLEPRVSRASVLRVLIAPRAAQVGRYELERQEGGAYRVERKDADGPTQTVRPGQPFRLGNVTLQLLPGLARRGPDRIGVAIVPFRRAVSALQAGTTVSRPNRMAKVVRVAYRSTDAQMAAAVPNAVGASFIAYKSRSGKTESSSRVLFLREQVSSYEGQLRTAEAALQQYRQTAQIVAPKEEADEEVRRLSALQAERDQAQVERNSLAALLERSRSAAARGDRDAYRMLASFPIFLANQAVQNLLRTITEVETQRAELLSRRTPENPDVQAADRRIADLEGQLHSIAGSYLQSLDSRLASLNTNLARFGSRLQQVPQREVQYARLMRQQALLEEIYTLLQKRLKEAEIDEAVQFGDVSMLDPAIIPERAVAPRPALNLALATIIGLMLGVGVAIIRQTLDTKVRSQDDAVGASGGAPVLASIPRIRTNVPRGARGVVPVAPESLVQRSLVVHHDPRSPVSEAYRALRTNIAFANLEHPPRVLVVTSAMPADGKSTSAANLALTLAEQGARTVLVDADLRRGVLHNLFDMRAEPGLTHVLAGRASLADALQQVPSADGEASSLFFIPAGLFPPNPAEMLGSSQMRKVLDELRAQFEFVVLDAPPLNLVTDGAVLGTLADTTILVARSGVTEKSALQRAVLQVEHLNSRIGGIVLNDVTEQGAGYGYYGYGYGYSSGGEYNGNGNGAGVIANGNGNGNGKKG